MLSNSKSVDITPLKHSFHDVISTLLQLAGVSGQMVKRLFAIVR